RRGWGGTGGMGVRGGAPRSSPAPARPPGERLTRTPSRRSSTSSRRSRRPAPMWALDPFSPPRSVRLFADTPLPLLATLATGAAVTWALVDRGVLPASALRVAGVTAGHGALLATALAWARV